MLYRFVSWRRGQPLDNALAQVILFDFRTTKIENEFSTNFKRQDKKEKKLEV